MLSNITNSKTFLVTFTRSVEAEETGETVSNKEIKHREEIKALVTEEELDQLQ